MADGVADYNPKTEYFKFNGNNEFPAGIVCTPLMGEVEVGRIYPVNTETSQEFADILRDHQDWSKVARTDWNKQLKADADAANHEGAINDSE